MFFQKLPSLLFLDANKDLSCRIQNCKWPITLADALRLKPGHSSESHLSGNLIDAYLNFLVANYTNIKALSLSLITHYSRHKSLPRRINLDWIIDFDGTLFVPIHLPQHWALLVANFKECTLTTMDSLNMDHFLNCDILLFIRNFR